MVDATRHDTIWKDAGAAAGYQISRNSIPFADVHFEIMHRLIDESGIVAHNVLDLGAGDGIAVAEIAKRQPVTRATLTDFSDAMFAPARQRMTGLPQIDAAFVVGDFRESTWHTDVAASGPFDVIVSRFAIHHIPDDQKSELYGAIFDWLVPGGIFINIEHVASTSDLYHRAHDRLMVDCLVASNADHADYDEVCRQYRLRADGGANILATVETQLGWLRERGYVDVDCAFKCFELTVFAGRRPHRNEGTTGEYAENAG